MSVCAAGVGVLPVSAQDDQSDGGQCLDLIQHPQQVPTQVSRSMVMFGQAHTKNYIHKFRKHAFNCNINNMENISSAPQFSGISK